MSVCAIVRCPCVTYPCPPPQTRGGRCSRLPSPRRVPAERQGPAADPPPCCGTSSCPTEVSAPHYTSRPVIRPAAGQAWTRDIRKRRPRCQVIWIRELAPVLYFGAARILCRAVFLGFRVARLPRKSCLVPGEVVCDWLSVSCRPVPSSSAVKSTTTRQGTAL